MSLPTSSSGDNNFLRGEVYRSHDVIEKLRMQASRRETEVRGLREMLANQEAANRQLEHTLNRIFIGDCLDPKETARAGLEEATRRSKG